MLGCLWVCSKHDEVSFVLKCAGFVSMRTLRFVTGSKVAVNEHDFCEEMRIDDKLLIRVTLPAKCPVLHRKLKGQKAISRAYRW